ncbi:Glucomannan 4-beta-mannosyltransferase 9 [Glycine soja]
MNALCLSIGNQESHQMDRLSSAATFESMHYGSASQMGLIWQQARAPLVVPLMKLLVVLCLAMSLMLFVERVYMGIVIIFVKLFRYKPEKKYKWEPLRDDLEFGNSAYPMVLVQIPMYNEKEVYQLSIGAACGLSWPSDRVIIQVLDDSTDPIIKNMVEVECQRWASKGVNIKYEIRENRNGYKAGALKEGMKHSYVNLCDYVAIFDADFQPEPNFLWRTIPFLAYNPEVALVQARWKFVKNIFFFRHLLNPCNNSPNSNMTKETMEIGRSTCKFRGKTLRIMKCLQNGLPHLDMEMGEGVNADECLMTRMQEMSLDYHFLVEQEVGSSTYAFFGFNGTAGVWRISALNEAGGWKDRTTVEDMDLAVRAGLKGGKFVYLSDLKVKSELPSTFKAYRYQQHRWSCGPANLFKKMAMEIMRNKKVSMWKKLYVIYSFFFVRKIVAHVVTFVFYCVIMPATVLVPEVEVPKWGAVYIPSIITLLNAVGTPRSIHLLVFWILFENVMSMHRTKATLTGLLEAGRVNEWVVTEKLGDALKTKSGGKAARKPRIRIGERLHFLELLVGAYLFFCACYDLKYGKNHYFIYLFLQSMAFFVAGVGYVGTFVPNS